MANMTNAALCFEDGTFKFRWEVGEKENLRPIAHNGLVQEAVPVETDGIVVNISSDGDIIGTKYGGREFSEPYWDGDEREGGGYRHAIVREIGGQKYAIF